MTTRGRGPDEPRRRSGPPGRRAGLVAAALTAVATLGATALAVPGAAETRAPDDRPQAAAVRQVEPGAAPAPVVPLDPALSWHPLTWQTPRRYLLATPDRAGPHPLLVVLHGLNQRTDTFLRETGLVQAALDRGVAVVGPETPDGSWNDGRFGQAGRDDDGYVLAVVDQLVADGVADPARVVLVGFSNGAGLSMEILARHPDLVHAAVLVGGELLAGRDAPRPGSPVPVSLVHGTDDPVQPWAGRPRLSRRLPSTAGVPATVSAFAAAVGAGRPEPPQTLPHFPGRIPVRAQRWPGPTASLTLYSLLDAGHVWPVSSCPPRTACRPGSDVARPADVSATELAVEAALTAPRPLTVPAPRRGSHPAAQVRLGWGAGPPGVGRLP